MITFRTTSGEVIQPPAYTPKGAAPKKGATAKPEAKATGPEE